MAKEFETRLGGEVLADTMIELVKEGVDLVAIENDLRFTFTNRFGEAYPDRFIEAGIAEANSIGIAAGMSEAGMTPVVHSLTPFITRRCYDQVVISIQYSGLKVKLVGTDPGIYSELNGGTHLSIEDVAIMRAVPGMVIVDAIDNTALANLSRQLLKDDRSCYLRMARKLPRKVYDENATFEIGKANVVTEGTDMTIIANGIMVAWSMDVAEELAKEGISVKVLDMHTIKPLDREAVIEAAKMGPVVTAENATIVGGLGSAVAEVIAEEGIATRFERIGIRDRYGVVGFIADISEELEMTPDHIKAACLRVMGK
ncbi:MAG: transketolase family protein [Clostridia bacterium]|nr:transketolase family protein [Clostridia bacterium]